ncbi:hypothetical protein MHAE_10091 [Mycobacterium haemophilum DSM 44634]
MDHASAPRCGGADIATTANAVTPGVAKASTRESAKPFAQRDPGYDSAGAPTFESVRKKTESRYATALGAAELDAETSHGRTVEEQYEERQRRAAERLAQIREAMRSDES